MAYTTSDILVRALMQGVSGLPRDVYVNDFAFHWRGSGAPADSDLTNLFGDVDLFYNHVGTGTFKVSKFIGQAVDRAATHELAAYTIAVPMGSPRLTAPWLGPAAPATVDHNLPTEVAGVVSFYADLTGVLEESGATRPRARRRGRLYVGPLTTDAVIISDDNPLLNPSFTQIMRESIDAMAAAALAHDFDFSVWSRADATLRTVIAGWTDNAPDTQRRRGATSTSRTTFTL